MGVGVGGCRVSRCKGGWMGVWGRCSHVRPYASAAMRPPMRPSARGIPDCGGIPHS